jgi:hypothetical protein
MSIKIGVSMATLDPKKVTEGLFCVLKAPKSALSESIGRRSIGFYT